MKYLVAIAFSLASYSVFADDRHIGITGYGVYEIAPESAEIVFFSEALKDTPILAKQAVDVALGVLIEKTEHLAGKIILNGGNLSVKEDRQYNTGQSRGYIATRRINISVLELAVLDEVIDLTLAAGITRFTSINFDVKDPKIAKSEARRLAVLDARSKASDYANSMGLKLGKILELVDSNYANMKKQYGAKRLESTRYEAVLIKGVFVPKTVEFKDQIHIKYEIK